MRGVLCMLWSHEGFCTLGGHAVCVCAQQQLLASRAGLLISPAPFPDTMRFTPGTQATAAATGSAALVPAAGARLPQLLARLWMMCPA